MPPTRRPNRNDDRYLPLLVAHIGAQFGTPKSRLQWDAAIDEAIGAADLTLLKLDDQNGADRDAEEAERTVPSETVAELDKQPL